MKLVSKKYKIPMYFDYLVIVQDKDDKKIAKKYGLEGTETFDGCFFTKHSKDGHTKYVIAFFGKASPSAIAHEAVHVVNQIFKDRYIKLDIDNDEPQAYLLGWVVEKCHETLKLK